MPSGPRSAVGPVDDKRLAGLIEPVVAGVGMDLESVRMTVVGRRRLLRIVVDGDHGVSLDEAADVSREVSAMLDAASVLGDVPYTLEVSSPGVDRPLTEPRHWRRAAGRLVKVKVTGDGAVEGRVLAADADGVTLDLAGVQRRLGYGELGAGAVQIEFGRIADAELDEFVDPELDDTVLDDTVLDDDGDTALDNTVPNNNAVPENDTDIGAGGDGH
jgi:ribosome maturation factor RimP